MLMKILSNPVCDQSKSELNKQTNKKTQLDFSCKTEDVSLPNQVALSVQNVCNV